MVQIKTLTTKNDLTYINNELADGMYIDDDGDLYWYKKGKMHRDNDKPAVMYSSGYKAWFQNGLRHRDGNKPAIIRGNGDKLWYKNGVRYHADIRNKYGSS